MLSVVRRPSAGLTGLFDDGLDFDAVMEAAMEADPGAWQLPVPAAAVPAKKAMPVVSLPVQATAATAPACVVSASAMRCVDATHSSPCPWCVARTRAGVRRGKVSTPVSQEAVSHPSRRASWPLSAALAPQVHERAQR